MEEWRLLASLNNRYEVSDTGKIRNAKSKKELATFENRFGYYILQVCPQKGERKERQVHVLVAEAFIGKRPNGYVINHKDGNKKNNVPSNLEYVTSAENNIHALHNGLRRPAIMKGKVPVGEKHYKATINEKTVKEIWRIRKETGYGGRRIAKMLGISNGVVSGVLYRKRWEHVDLKGE